MSPAPPLVLASASPGRAALLRAAGFVFTQHPTHAAEPEAAAGAEPVAHASRLARIKAEAALPRHPGCLVLAADTLVFHEKHILGKPRDAEHAAEMLLALRGRAHYIVSALCLAATAPGRPARFESGAEVARVFLRNWSPARIRRHVENVNPLFCAGGYALQEGGAALVARLDGDPSTVIGLPLDLLDRLLGRFHYPDPGSG